MDPDHPHTRSSRIPRPSLQQRSPSPPKGDRYSTLSPTPEQLSNASGTLVQQLKNEITQLKRKLEEENSLIKTLKHEKVKEIKKVRTEEQGKSKNALEDQRYKLNQEKERSLENLRAQLAKQHASEMSKILKERESLSKANRDADKERMSFTQNLQEEMRTEAKEEAKKLFTAEKNRFIQEIEELNRKKRELEEQLKNESLAGRHKLEDYKRLNEEHQREIDQLRKHARKDIILLLDELKAKDRIILELEKELGHQAGYASELAGENGSSKNLLNLTKMRDTWEKMTSSKPTTSKKERAVRNLGTESLSQSSSSLDESKVSTHTSDENQRAEISDVSKVSSRGSPSPSTIVSARDSLIPRRGTSSRGSPMPLRGSPLPKESTKFRRSLPVLSPPARSSTPTRQVTDSLQSRLREAEDAKRKAERKCKMLSDELKSMKKDIPKNRRPQSPWTTEKMDLLTTQKVSKKPAHVRRRVDNEEMREREEEISRLRRQMDDQFEEIVALKQAAMAERNRQLFGRRNSLPLETQSEFDVSLNSSLAISEADDLHSLGRSISRPDLDSRESLTTPSWNDNKLEAAEETIQGLKEKLQEMEASKEMLLSELHDSKEQNELLEFQLLEAAESGKRTTGREMSFTDELLREILRYMQTHEGKEIDLSEIKQQIDQLSQEKVGKLSDADQESLESLREILELVEVEVGRLREKELDLQEEVREKSEEVHTLASELTQLLTQLTEKEETIQVTNKKVDELLENEFDLSEKIKDYETQVALLQEELLEARDKDAREFEPDDSYPSEPVVEKADSEEGEKTPGKSQADKEVQVKFRRPQRQNRGMSGEYDFDDVDGEEEEDVTFSDDDFIGDLLPDEDDGEAGGAGVRNGDTEGVDEMELKLEKAEVQEQRSSPVPREGLGGVDSRDSHTGESNMMQGTVQSLEEEKHGLLTKQNELQSEICSLKETISHLENKVSESEGNNETMSKVISDQIVQMQNLRKDSENLISKDAVEMREKELQGMIKDLQDKEKEMQREMEKMNEERRIQMEMLESERRMIEDRLLEAEGEKKLLRDALEKEKLSKDDEVSGEEGVRFYKDEAERLKFVIEELNEKQAQAGELVASLESELQNVRQQLERQETEKKELEGSCSQLKEQRQEAEDNLKMKKEELHYLLREKGEMEIVRDELQREIVNLKEKVLQKNEDIPKVVEQCEDETEMKKEEIKNLKERVADLEYENKVLINYRDEAESLKEQIKMLEAEKGPLEESLEVVSSVRDKLIQDLEGIEKAKEEAVKERKEKEDELMELKKAVEDVESRLVEKDAEVEEIGKMKDRETRELSEKLDILQKEVEMLQKRNEQVSGEKEQTESLKEEKGKLLCEKISLEERVNQLQSLETELEQEVKEEREKSSTIEMENDKMFEEIKHLKSLLEEQTTEKDGNIYEELQEKVLQLEIEKGSLEGDLLKEKSENEKLRKDRENMEVVIKQMGDREVELKGIISELEVVREKEDGYERKIKDQESEINALQRKVEDLSIEVQVLENKSKKLEESEAKLFSDSFEKDAKIQVMRAKEMELEETVRKLMMEAAGAEKQLGEGGELMDELEARKIKIGDLEDELEKIRVEGELLFDNNGNSSDSEDSRGLREDFEREGYLTERGDQPGEDLSEDGDNIYSVVEQEIWEEVQVSVVRPTAMAPPMVEGQSGDNELDIFGHDNNSAGLEEQEEESTLLNRRIEMLEAEVQSQKGLLQEETLAKEKLQKEIWEMLQTQSDLRQQLTTLQDQNDGLQANMKFLRELEEETESLTARVEKMTEEKRVLEAKMREVEASKAENDEKLEEKGRELDKIKEQVDAIEEERKMLMDKLKQMENAMKARLGGLEASERFEYLDSEKQDSSRELEESLKDEIRKLEERNSLLEEQLHDKTRISLDTSEMDSLLFSSDDEGEFDARVDEAVEEKVKRLEKLNHALKEQVKHLLAFQNLGVEDSGLVREDVEDEAGLKERNETEEDKGSSLDGKNSEEDVGNVANVEDLKKQLALSEENNKYLEQQLEDLRQLMQDGGFENQDVLIEKVEVLEKSQKQLVSEIESLKKDLADKEDELLNTQAEMLSSERKFSMRVEELEKSEQSLLEKLEATNEEWRQQSENSMERIGELENVRGQLREQLSRVGEQLEELQVGGGFDNLSSTQQSGPSLLDEGLGALDIGRSSFDYTDDFDEEDGDAMQQEMEEALRELDEEGDEDGVTVLKEENKKLMGRVEELEKSEVELMEKVGILEQSELAMSDLCDKLKADIDLKTSEMTELREKLSRLENVEDQNNYDAKEKQGILEEEVKHLQEQMSFMEEERKSFLIKIEEMEIERDVKEMEEKEEQQTTKMEILLQEKGAQVMLEENKVEISIKQWQEQRLEEIQHVEKPVRVRTVAPYNTPLPYWKLGMANASECNQVRVEVVDWTQTSVEEDEYLQEFADEEEFLQTVVSCVEQRKPNTVEMNFEEKLLEEEQEFMNVVEEDERVERLDDLGERELSEMKEQSNQVRNALIYQNFEEVVLKPDDRESEVGEGKEEEKIDEEPNFDYCDEPMICKEEVLTEQITDEVFMPLRCENQDNSIDSAKSVRQDDGEEIQSLKEKIRYLEENEEILKERILVLEGDERSMVDSSEIAEEDGSRTGEESKDDLKMKIRDLEENEVILKAKIEEMEIMQSALEETLSQADAIVREREAEYLEKIEALESSQSDLRHLLEEPSSIDQVSGDAFDKEVTGEAKDWKVEEEAVMEKIEKLENLVEEKESQILILEASLEEKIDIEKNFKEQSAALQDKIEMLGQGEEERDQLIKEMEKQLEEEGAKADREGSLKERIADLEETVAKKAEQILQLESELADVSSQQGGGDPSQEAADVEASNVSGEATAADAKVDQADSVQSGILEKRIEELENSEIKLITELEESLENEEKLKEEVQTLEKLKNDIVNERDEFRERAKDLESDINELKSKLDVMEDEKEKTLEEIAKKAKALEEMQEMKKMLEEDRDEKRAEMEELYRLGEKKDEEVIMMTEDLEAKSKRLKELDGIVKTLEMGVENLTSKLVEEEEKVRGAEAEVEKVMREKEQVEDEVRHLKEMLETNGKRSLSGRDDGSHPQAGDVERGMEKEDDTKQTRDQEDESDAVEDGISTQGDAEETLSVLQEELHLANIQIEDLKRSKIALEEQLKKLRSNRRSSSMITLPEDEYLSLKARAQMVDTPEDSEETVDLNSTNDEEQFANAGKLWVKLDQTTKELRKYQELYNTTIKEVGHLKQALREVSEKHEAYLQGRRGSMLIDTVALPHSESDKTVDHKSIQTRPLKTIASDALRVRLATDTARSQPITLQELLEAIPEPTELGDILMPKGSPAQPEMIAADDRLFLLDSPSPFKTTPTHGALSDSFLNTSMWPPDLAKHEKQGAWEEIQSALASENMSEEGDTPPLPKSMPPRTSSNLSFAETPDLPDLPPPNEFSFLSDDDDFQKDEVDLDLSEVKKITAQTQGEQQGVQPGPPPVSPKPAAPDWLKEMQLKEWEKALKEAEEMRNKLQELEEKVEEKEEQLNQLKVGREELELKAREAQDVDHYKEKLQEKEEELEDKEKQILRLKGDLKKKEAEATPLKLQLESLKEKQVKLLQENGQTWQLKDKLERLQDQYKDKEQSMRLLEAEKMRLKEDIEGKDRKLFSKEREVEKCREEIEILKEKLRDYEKGRNQKSDEEIESEKEYLKKQNEQLRKQVDQLEPLKERMDNFQSQLEKGLSSQENSSSLMRKLQQAEKMLEEKTADELRLLEDNECLQKRINNLEKEKNYRDELEADYESMKEMFNELEYKKHEAELSVAPLKAKVSYLLKKFQEKDAVLRQMASEVAVKNPERASEIFDEIEKLQHQLPLEDIHPRKMAWEDKPFNFDRRKAKSLDVLNNNGSEVIEDSLGRNAGVSLQDLIKEASKPAVGSFSLTSDIGRSQDSLLAALPELKSNHRGSLHAKERNAGRRRKSKLKVSSSESDDTLNGLLQSDAEDSVDFAISDTSSSHLPNLLSTSGIMALGTSSPTVNVSHHTRPPLLRTMKTDLGTGGKPSPMSSMERTQPVNGVNALTSGIPHRGIGSNDSGGIMLPPGHLNGVPQSGTGVVPLVSSGPTIPSSGVAGLTGPFTKNTMPMFNQPHSKGIGTLQQNGPPLNRGPAGNTINNNSGNVPPMNGTMWNSAPRVPTSHDLSTSLSSSLPSSHVLPSGGNHHITAGTGYSPPTTGVLQPPRSLSVARMVSKQSVLLVWSLPVLDEMTRNNGHEVAGYKIYVNGNLKQFVTSPHLAKALVTNLNLKMVRTFGIQTVSVHGKGSSVRQVNFSLPHSDVSQSGMSDASLSDSAREPSTDASSVVGERPKQRMFMAVYSYNPMEHSPNENPERELTFKEGDLIRVQGHMRNDGFYHGMINGIKGLVPSNFIEEISISSSGKKKTRQEAPRKQPQKEVSKMRKEKESGHRVHSKSSQSKV